MTTKKPGPKNLGIGAPPAAAPKTPATGGTVAPPTFGGTSGPSITAGVLGVSQADQSALAPQGTAAFLGLAPDGGRTIGSAVTELYTLPKAQIANIQNELRAAHILTGKYTAGVMDTTTKDAVTTALGESVASKVPIQQYISTSQGASTVSAASTAGGGSTALPSLADPAQIATSLETAATAYGKNATQAQLNKFTAQIRSAEENRKGSGVQVDVASEAQLFAAQEFGSTGTTKVAASTDADINKAAATFGVTLSAAQRSNIAAQVDANSKVTGSPDVNLLNQLVAKQFRMPSDPSTLSGDAATLQNDLQKLAGQYLIPASATTISNFVTKGIQNQSYAGGLAGDTEAEFEQYLRQQAATLYPWLAQSTQNFQTVNPWDATASYRTQISNVLGLGNPDSVDLTSAKYSPLLKTDANGQPPTLGEINQTLLTDPQYGYDSSPNGIARGYNVGVSLAKSLGVNLAGV